MDGVGVTTTASRLPDGPALMVVLFTDLVASTEQRARLGDVDADRLHRTHDRVIADVVAGHRGHVVKNLGDGTMAAFGGASEAVAAAVAAQLALDHHNRTTRDGEQLQVRMGLSAGEVSVEHGDVFGSPVVEAARLCALAHGEEILASDLVRVLAGSRTTASFSPRGPVQLKGLNEPVVAHEVEWRRPAGHGELPPALRSIDADQLVGRDRERAEANEALDAAGGDVPAAVVLVGEAGIGKTAIAAAVAHEAHGRGAHVLYGRCAETVALPFQPFVEALRQYVRETSASVIGSRLGRRPGELLRVAPDLADRLPSSAAASADAGTGDRIADQHLFFDAVASWLEQASSTGLVTLVIDDLHWADAPTAQLLAHLLTTPMAHRPLIVVTCREGELDRRHPVRRLLDDLPRLSPAARTVRLGPLDDEAVACLVTATAGDGVVPPSLATRLREETDGNPLFVTEVVRHLVDGRVLWRRRGVWELDPSAGVQIPDSVRDVIERRMARLTVDGAEILAAGSVLGTEFELPGVLALTSRPSDVVLDALDGAVRADLLLEAAATAGGLRYRFPHALVHGAVYQSMTATRRAQLHFRAVESISARLGDRGEHIADVARHAEAAGGLVDRDRTVTLLRAAGDRALAQLAGEQASDWYERALLLCDHGGDDAQEDVRCELLLSLGLAQRWAGKRASRETLLTAARLAADGGDTDRLVRAALANSRGNFSELYRVDEERVAVLREALAALDAVSPGPSPTRARLMATLAVELIFGRVDDERLQMADEALEMARAVGDERDVADLLALHLNAAHTMDRMPERLAHSAELVAVAERLGEAPRLYEAHRARVLVSLENADPDDVLRCEEGFRRLEGRYPQLWIDYVVSQNSAYRALLRGDLEEADALALDGLQSGKGVGHPDAYLFYGSQLIGIRRAQGRLDELLAAVDASPDPFGVTAPYVARIHWEAGDPEGARQRWDETVVVPIERLAVVGQVAGTHLVSRAFMACRLGDEGEAARLYDVMLPWAPLTLNPLEPHPATHHFLGMLATTLGRLDDAVAHFEAAQAIHQRLGAPLHLGRTSIERARALLARNAPGDADHADALLCEAAVIGEERGAGELVRDAGALVTPGSVLSPPQP